MSIRTCLFTQSLFSLSLPDAIRAAADAGYSAVELACCAPHLDADTARTQGRDVAKEIGEAGLEVAALSLFSSFTDPETAASEVREALQFIALAPLFGSRVVKLTPGLPASVLSTDRHWQRLRRCVRLLVPAAEEYGVRLAVETHMRQLTDTLASTLRFLDMVPPERVGVTLDFSNLRFAGEEMREVIPALAGRIFHAHVKNGVVDSEGGWHFGALDKGKTDYEEVIALLREAGYDGFLSVECLGPEAGTDPVATIRRDLNVLRGYLGK